MQIKKNILSTNGVILPYHIKTMSMSIFRDIVFELAILFEGLLKSQLYLLKLIDLVAEAL